MQLGALVAAYIITHQQHITSWCERCADDSLPAQGQSLPPGCYFGSHLYRDRPHLHDAADIRQKTDVLTIWREARAIGCAYIEITLETIGFCHAFYLLCFRSDCITSPPPITSEARTMLIDRRVAARFRPFTASSRLSTARRTVSWSLASLSRIVSVRLGVFSTRCFISSTQAKMRPGVSCALIRPSITFSM